MKKLENKVALITGGSSGIGKSIALRYVKEGAKVIIVGRNENNLKEVLELDNNINYIIGDITDYNTIKEIRNKLEREYNGRLDILVNNAGWCPVEPLIEMTIADYDKAFSLDVRAVVELTINTLPLIIKIKGNIINLSTVGSTHRAPNLSMYLGAKAAIDNFTRVWALELAEHGVRVNAIALGAIDTNIWNVTDLAEVDAKKHRDNIASTIPFKRFGSPDEIANVALFLVLDEDSYISGSIVAVDGGSGAI